MLYEALKSVKQYNELLEVIRGGKSVSSVFGVPESARPHFTAALLNDTDKQILYITHNSFEAGVAYEDFLELIGEGVYLLPAREPFLHGINTNDKETATKRAGTFSAITLSKAKVVVASIDALQQRTAPLDVFKKNTVHLRKAEEYDTRNFIKSLLDMGYSKEDVVENEGEFAYRGGIIDVFCPGEPYPCRIEFFGDEIDTIRYFMPETQRSTEELDELFIMPATDILLDMNDSQRYIKAIDKELKTVKKEFADEIGYTNLLNLKNAIEEDSQSEYALNYLSILYENPSCAIDYMPLNSLFVMDETVSVYNSAKSKEEQFSQDYKYALTKGHTTRSTAHYFIDIQQIFYDISEKNTVCFKFITGAEKGLNASSLFKFEANGTTLYSGNIRLLAEDLKYYKKKNYRTLLLCGNVDRAEKLQKELTAFDIESIKFENDLNTDKGQIAVSAGNLSKGFEYRDADLIILTPKDIFGVSKKKAAKKVKAKSSESIFAQIKPGDFVVHESHGIGLFEGVKKRMVDGASRDFFVLKYLGSDRLYIPAEQMDKVQKYMGGADRTPKLNKLGSSDWDKTKSRVRASLKELAYDLAKLYAYRTEENGFAFSKDSIWQSEFEENFQYEETPDQLRCIEEMKADMESKRIMDRLICGDVGYGKTEVAIRGAFKAVLDSKQVAFLAPTTILAQQHYNTITERMHGFPVKVDVLSRFKSKKEQQEIIKKLKSGELDIVVGTHRLLGKDIKFKDLGLLIVDEEQRFGVSHKEQIKNFKQSVDVLTLSATPIPRTLHMSLLGIRDMSIIKTPPEERFPVNTYIMEYDLNVVKDAIYREVSRGGQVYFVYNNVANMDKMVLDLKTVMPDISFAMAHGQMNETMLEKIMMDFYNGEQDVLVCSTIIESGLDIPNVNTLIVYNADKLGLSQLYQLRGRVGRSNKMAYAYITYVRDKVLSEIAQKRLVAMREFTDFGAGFKLAMRDLEIRGAGNILGPEQHGHMHDVGYDMYCKLMKEAVEEVKNEQSNVIEVETTIDVKEEAHIPEKYIQSQQVRIDMYKRIAGAENEDDMRDIIDELIDRFGDVPKAVMNLLHISVLKNMAQKVLITGITVRDDFINIKFHPNTPIDLSELINLAKEDTNIMLISGDAPSILYKQKGKGKYKPKLTRENAEDLLKRLLVHCLRPKDI